MLISLYGSSTVPATGLCGSSIMLATGGLRRVLDTDSFGGSSTILATYLGGLG